MKRSIDEANEDNKIILPALPRGPPPEIFNPKGSVSPIQLKDVFNIIKEPPIIPIALRPPSPEIIPPELHTKSRLIFYPAFNYLLVVNSTLFSGNDLNPARFTVYALECLNKANICPERIERINGNMVLDCKELKLNNPLLITAALTVKNITIYPPIRLREYSQNLYSINCLTKWEKTTIRTFWPDNSTIKTYRSTDIHDTYSRLLKALSSFVTYGMAWMHPVDINYFCYFLINYFDECIRAATVL